MKSFLEKLQSADEDIKRRWMIGATIVIMVIVVYIWMAYFNTLISGFSPSQVSVSDQTAAGSHGFWFTMKNGMSTIYNMFMSAAGGFGKILNAPREYIVKPPN